jgi:hypothetical protein
VFKYVETITRKRTDGALVPVSGGTCTIYEGGTPDLLTIYADDETTEILNPITSDSNGLVQAKIPDGVFDAVFSDGLTTKTILGLIASDGVPGQEVVASVSTVVTCTTVMPVDDTIPQNTEGDQVATVSITPEKADSQIEITVNACGSTSAGMFVAAAVFQDSVTDAISGSPSVEQTTGPNQKFNIAWSFNVAASSVAARTYKLRIGPHSAGAVYVNGSNGGGRIFGGSMQTSITAREVRA